MVRTQIQLTEEQARRLRQLASDRGVSVAELIREAVDRNLDESVPARAKAISLIGGFRSGRSDIGREHDRYLAEDFQS